MSHGGMDLRKGGDGGANLGMGVSADISGGAHDALLVVAFYSPELCDVWGKRLAAGAGEGLKDGLVLGAGADGGGEGADEGLCGAAFAGCVRGEVDVDGGVEGDEGLEVARKGLDGEGLVCAEDGGCVVEARPGWGGTGVSGLTAQRVRSC